MSNPFRSIQLTDWTDAGEERRNKRRSVGEPNTIPDLQIAAVREGLDANRSIIERHVESICNQLSVTDRRYDPNNRCQASASRELLDAILASFTPEELEKSRNLSACQPGDLPVVNLEEILNFEAIFNDQDDCPTITLEAGQHRRAAVLKMAHLPITSTVGVFKKDDLHLNNQTTMWPVEFWTTEYLRSKPLVAARLRYNSTDAKQGSSFGDDFAVLHKVWDAMTEEQKGQILSQKAFTNFLGHLLPGSSVATTWLPLLKHDDWRANIERVVKIPWGRSVLVASQLTRAFASHYPDPFFSIITAAMNWFHAHFQGVEERVDAEDMQYLIQKSSDFSKFNMLALFFPIWEKDFKVSRRGKIEGNMHRLSKDAIHAAIEREEQPAFFPLATPFEFRGEQYPNRRPDFLSLLSDTEYTGLFMRLHRLDERGAFPAWTKVMKDDSQFTANVFHSIMKHVVCWAVPGFKVPASGSSSAISYTWPGLILEHLMPLRKLESVVEPVLPAEKNDSKKSAGIFVKAIWQHSSTYCRDFLVEEARPYLSEMPPFAESSDNMETSAFEYTRRFTMFIWNAVLQTTFNFFGPIFSQETFMAIFNDKNAILEAKLPWTIWGATTEVANFIHNPELRRLPMIRNQSVRLELNHEARLFGAIFTYRQLKLRYIAHCRAADDALTSREQQPDVLSEGDRVLVETALRQYADYLNSVGIIQVDPFDLENLDLFRVSSILRFINTTRLRGDENEDRSDNQTPQPDPFVERQFSQLQTVPSVTPGKRKTHHARQMSL